MSDKKKNSDMLADLVIIGGGGAGLAAAVAAAEKGVDVILLEKRNCTGGNTAMASNIFAAESPVQRRAMIDASRDELFKAMIDWAHWKIDPRIIRAYVDKSGDTIRWLEEKGCSFDMMSFYPNQTPIVVHRPTQKAMVTDVLRKNCDALGVIILVRTTAKRILTDDNGEIAGVVVLNRNKEFKIATKKIIIATGGYGGNKELIRKYISSYHDNMRCLGLPNTGDGLTMGIEAGADIEGLGMLQIEGPCAPRSVRLMIDADGSRTVPIMLTQIAVEPCTVWVNKDGRRFVDEALGHSPFVAANAIVRQPDGICYAILDQVMIDMMSQKGIVLARGPLGRFLATSLPGLERELRLQSEAAALSYAQVDKDLCNGCGICVNSCPLDIIRLDTVVADKLEISPCRLGCPAGVDIRSYMYLVRQGMIKEAARVITESLPFPSITGRVCPHTCESHCARKEVDDAVNINGVERFIRDWLLSRKTETVPTTHLEKTAIIGSGPAGLACAYYLARSGYPVTVFEALPVLGGMLRVGIPSYRLPRAVLDSQIKCLKDMGVEFRTAVTVCKDISFSDLQASYKAIFFATGNQLSRKIPLEGVDDDVLWGLDFLRNVNFGGKMEVGRKVVVIGGGNVAVDVALTVLRLGAKEVRMVCLESGTEIPAHPEEIEQAVSEGVVIDQGWGPQKILRKNGAIKSLELARCISLFNEEGRFAPCLDVKEIKTVETDMVILAIGQTPDLTLIPQGLNLTDHNTVQVDPVTHETSLPGVFAGGDIVSGAATVVEALAAGKRAAISIERYYRKEDLKKNRENSPQALCNPPKEKIPPLPRQQKTVLNIQDRQCNFREVISGFDEDTVYLESQRCMTCGSRAIMNPVEECRLCQACERNCPQKAASIRPAKSGEPYVKIANTLQEIADWIEVNEETLRDTIEEYNNACNKGYDAIFAKDRRFLVPLNTPPFYAIKCNVDYLDTIGGIKINEYMEVIGKGGKPIPGLYAAGIDTGGWVGDTYCVRTTGTTFAFAINSGRIAGENATKTSSVMATSRIMEEDDDKINPGRKKNTNR